MPRYTLNKKKNHRKTNADHVAWIENAEKPDTFANFPKGK